MGGITSRQNAGVEEVDIGVNHAYRYPPKNGNYFSSHFIMGGERFDTAQPESYLFGENADLNFLGSRPAPFPYPAPLAHEPTKTLRAQINIRKESLRFVRAFDASAELKDTEERPVNNRFNIEFTFDSDVRCAITIMYFCTEEVTPAGFIYTPRDSSMNSETYHYKRGTNQQFSQVCHIFDPSQFPEEDLLYIYEKEIIPICIFCLSEEGEEPRQSHVTIGVVEKHSDGYVLKPLKQKLFVDGLSYLLQEIYGIENKNTDTGKISNEEDTEDNGAECVICMCDLRDTLILPCRHLCLCNSCADSLRYQANNCPICRAPFRALIQFKAVQKIQGGPTALPASTTPAEGGDNVPAGYEAISLIEALNGPTSPQPSAPTSDLYVKLPPEAPNNTSTVQSDASRCFIEAVNGHAGSHEDSTTQTESSATPVENRTPGGAASEMRMSVLLAQECEEVIGTTKLDPGFVAGKKKSAARKHSREKQHYSSKDSIKIVNEVSGQKGKEQTTDPSEARSLLDEEGHDAVTEVSVEKSPSFPEEILQAPQARLDSIENSDLEDESEAEEQEASQKEHHEEVEAEDSQSVKEGNELHEDFGAFCLEESCSTDVQKVEEGNTMASSLQQTKNPRRTERASSPSASQANAVMTNPSGGLPQHSESLSLPGTPLSNASAISRSSETSMSSSSSTRALLPQPADRCPASIV